MRYLEWAYDPDEQDTTYVVDFAYLLRDRDGSVRVEHDRHICGLFSRDVWVQSVEDVGFVAQVMKDPFGRDLFVGTKRQRTGR